MLSKREFPLLNRATRRGVPASWRKGPRNPVSAADQMVVALKKVGFSLYG